MEQKTSNKNSIIALCVAVAVIVVALAAYFIISGQKGENQPTVSATMELNTVNIYGAWYKKAGDSTYELRFKDNKELSYKQTAADGTVTAQSDEGSYDIADGKLILTIVAGGQTYSDTCTANVNEKQMSIVADANGSGLFNGIYDKDGADYSVPDVSDDEPSEAPDTTSAQTTVAPETTTTTAATTPAPETTAQTTAATTPAPETAAQTIAATTPAPETTAAETQAEAPAVTNGTIALPDYIQYYFDNDFADVWGITASIYTGYYACYEKDGLDIYYCRKDFIQDHPILGRGKAIMVECPIISFFTDFDGYVTYGAFSNYLYENYGNYITLRDDGTFATYDDGTYVIYFNFASGVEISASTLIGDGNIVICEEQEYYRETL